MKAFIQWIQIGNWLSTSYKANASTDQATVVGGVSVSAAVFAVLATLAQAKPDLGLTMDLIATVTALVGATASQVIPWIKNWFDQRAAARQAAAKAAVDGSAFSARLAAERAALPTPVSGDDAAGLPAITDETPIVSWQKDGGIPHAALGACMTVGDARLFGATSAVLKDGRVWVL